MKGIEIMFNHILKKISALTLCCIFTLCCVVMPVSADENSPLTEKMILDLQAFDILEGMDDGELHLEDEVTRAQMCRIIARVMQVDGGTYEGALYSDVTSQHWAYQYINVMSSLGLVSGDTDGKFRPDDPVKYQEALKMLVLMLGYGIEAEEAGGYPMGYFSAGVRHGVTDGAGGMFDENLTRGQVMRMVYNCLDAPRLVQSGSSVNGSDVVTSDKTYRDLLMGDEEDGLIKVEGIVTATREFYLGNAIPDIDDGIVEIDGNLYECGDTDISSCFGMKVEAYVMTNPNGRYSIVKNYEVSKDNVVLEADVNDVSTLTNEQLVFVDSSDKKHSYKMAIDVQFLYNGRPIEGNDVSKLDVEGMEDAVLKFIGNTDKNEINVVMIDEYSSYLVDRVNTEDSRIYLDENQRFNNYRYIELDDENDDLSYTIKNNDGTRITIDQINSGDIVTVYASLDKTFIRVFVSNEEIVGKVSTIEESGRTINIDGEEYKYESTVNVDDIVGSEISAKLNYLGHIAYIDTSLDQTGNYGAVVSVFDSEDGNSLGMRIVVPGRIKDDVEEVESDDPNAQEIPAISAQNERVETLYTAQNVYFDGSRSDMSELKRRLENRMAETGKNYIVVEYALDKDGNLRTIESLEKMPVIPEAYYSDGTRMTVIDGEKNYNAYEKSFGGKANGAFGLGDNTLGLCIPSNETNSIADYMARIEMNNGQSYEVAAYKYNEETHCPDIVVFNEKMYGDTTGTITAKSKIGIVYDCFESVNDDGEIAKNISMITEDGEVTTVCSDTTSSGADFSALKSGDLIYYSLDALDRIDGYDLIVKVDPVPEDEYNGTSPEREVYIGNIIDADYRYVSDTLNKWVDSLIIGGVGLTEKTYAVQTSSAPPIYIYDTSRAKLDKKAWLGTSDDFLSEHKKAVVVSSYNVVKAVVIVK